MVLCTSCLVDLVLAASVVLTPEMEFRPTVVPFSLSLLSRLLFPCVSFSVPSRSCFIVVIYVCMCVLFGAQELWPGLSGYMAPLTAQVNLVCGYTQAGDEEDGEEEGGGTKL